MTSINFMGQLFPRISALMVIMVIAMLSFSVVAMAQIYDPGTDTTDTTTTNNGTGTATDDEIMQTTATGVVTVELNGSNEVPPTDSDAIGTADVTLDGNTLTIEGSFEGLESDLMNVSGSSAHLHRAAVGENGPIVFPLEVVADEDMRSGTFAFEWELTDAQVELLLDGEFYINVHSEDFENGEIRGQILMSHMQDDEADNNVIVDINQSVTVNQTQTQTQNQTITATTTSTTQFNQTNVARDVNIYIKDWYPKNNTAVFVCNATGFTPVSYSWFYGDGHKLLNIHNGDTFHEFEQPGNYLVTCTGHASDGTSYSDSMVFTVSGTPGSNVSRVCFTTGSIEQQAAAAGFDINNPDDLNELFNDQEELNNVLVSSATDANGNIIVTQTQTQTQTTNITFFQRLLIWLGLSDGADNDNNQTNTGTGNANNNTVNAPSGSTATNTTTTDTSGTDGTGTNTTDGSSDTTGQNTTA